MLRSISSLFSFSRGPVLILFLFSLLLLPNLSTVGLFEPFETALAARAEQYSPSQTTHVHSDPGGFVEERVVVASWSIFGRSLVATRAPILAGGLIALLFLFHFLKRQGGSRLATYGTLGVLFSSSFVLHAQQLTAGMPVLLGEVLAIAGLLLACREERSRWHLSYLVIGLTGLILGTAQAGAFIGCALPCGTVALTLAFGGAPLFLAPDATAKDRIATRILSAAGLIAVLIALAFAAARIFPALDIWFLTGSAPIEPLRSPSFARSLEPLAYGWFPLGTLLIVLLSLVLSPARDDGESTLIHLAVAESIIGITIHSLFLSAHGNAPLFLTVGYGAAIGVVATRLESQKNANAFVVSLVLLLCILLIRDFVEQPDKLFAAYGIDDIQIPAPLRFSLPDALTAAPFFLYIIAFGYTAARSELAAQWRQKLAPWFFVAAGATFSGYLSLFMLPALSVHLSPHQAIESLAGFRRNNEPVGILGTLGYPGTAKKLTTVPELIDRLSRPDRVLAIFPASMLPNVDKLYRARWKRHLHVLDAASSRRILAASQQGPQEENRNPIVPVVRDVPFNLGSATSIDVNFGDKIQLLGWDIRNQKGEKSLFLGDDVTITTFWHCVQSVDIDYEMFMHIDGPGGRIHGDHPLLGDWYSPSHWAPGDYLRDTYTIKIPLYQKKGTYSVRMGLYKDKTRLSIIGSAAAVENAIPIAVLELK